MNIEFRVQECIELAKRSIVDCIYSSAKIEGIAVTFPETQQLFDGISVPGLAVNDVVKINNLKHAWEFVFNSITYPMDLLYLRQLNQLINAGLMMDAGQVRGYDVQIGGTKWVPDLPIIEDIQAKLAALMSIPDVKDRAVSVMLYVMRSQIFSDGNKRVAQLAANQILIQNGVGYLKLPTDQMNEFYEKLVSYYETNNSRDIKAFILGTSIFEKKIVRNQNQPIISANMFLNRSTAITKEELNWDSDEPEI